MFSRPPALRAQRHKNQLHARPLHGPRHLGGAVDRVRDPVPPSRPDFRADFRGGIVVEVRTQPGRFRPGPRGAGHPACRGRRRAVLRRPRRRADPPRRAPASSADHEARTQALVDLVRHAVATLPGAQVLRADAVGASVSAELFRDGMLALGISLLMILGYIWFRFEWEFAVSAVITLILDLTKTVGFLVITHFEFDLVMVAAILTILGYSTNDKVVVYDGCARTCANTAPCRWPN
jgi:preprotein translocase SecF subunit